MVKTLYLMRHGQTMLNERKRIQGWFDSPLTERGREQALRAGRELAHRGVRPGRAICSTAERCSDTLELALQGLGMPQFPYTRLKSIKEMFFGELDGESERLASDDPQECRTYYVRYGGESSDAVRDRMALALADEMDALEGETLLAVSHGAACFNFTRLLRENVRFGNSAIAVLEYEPASRDSELLQVDNIGAPVPPEVARAAAGFTLREIIEIG